MNFKVQMIKNASINILFFGFQDQNDEKKN